MTNPQSPFRNDADALQSRLDALTEEKARLEAQAETLDGIHQRLAALEKERIQVEKEVAARRASRPTSYLDTLKVASPCHEPWEKMRGDEVTRFCERCQKHVHNLSEMTQENAETFLVQAAGSVCVRFYQRTDGTVLTADCPVGVRKRRVRRLFLATIGGGIATAAGALAVWAFEESSVQGEPAPLRTTDIELLGEVTEPARSPLPLPSATAKPPPEGTWLGGAPVYVPPKATIKTPPKPAPRMGRR